MLNPKSIIGVLIAEIVLNVCKEIIFNIAVSKKKLYRTLLINKLLLMSELGKQKRQSKKNRLRKTQRNALQLELEEILRIKRQEQAEKVQNEEEERRLE